MVNKRTHLPGYRVTECLVTGLSFDSSPISLNPMRPVVFVSRSHTWKPELSELQLWEFFGGGCHVVGGVCLVACNWRPGCLLPVTELPTCCIPPMPQQYLTSIVPVSVK